MKSRLLVICYVLNMNLIIILLQCNFMFRGKINERRTKLFFYQKVCHKIKYTSLIVYFSQKLEIWITPHRVN